MVNFVVDSQKAWPIARRLWKDIDPKAYRDGIKWDKIFVWDKIKLPIKPETLEKIKKSATWPRNVENNLDPEVKGDDEKKWVELDETEIVSDLQKAIKQIIEPTNYNSVEIWSFQEWWEEVEIDLIRRVKDGITWYYLEVDSPFFWDSISDSEASIKIEWELTEEKVKQAMKEVESTYKRLYLERNKDPETWKMLTGIDKTIKKVTEATNYSSKKVWWFKVEEWWEEVEIDLIRRVGARDKFTWYYVEVDSPFWDGISDSEASIKIEWELTKQKVEDAIKKVEATYKKLYEDKNKDK